MVASAKQDKAVGDHRAVAAWQVELEHGLKFISPVPQASDVDSRTLQKNHICTACAYAGLYRKIWLRRPKGLGGQI